MRNLTYAAIALAAIAGVAPAMAQPVQPTTPPITVDPQLSATANGQSMPSQDYRQPSPAYGGGLLAPGTLGGDYGQPSPTQGIPGGNQPSASYHSPE